MFKKILLPVDLEEESSWKDALPAALRMAKDDGAELHILTVVPPLPGQIEAFAKDHAGGTKVVPHLAQGQPYSAIIDLAEKIGADLIVMGSHRPELKDYLLGPNAARVVRHAACSVMVVRK